MGVSNGHSVDNERMMGVMKDETDLTEEELSQMFDAGRPVQLLEQRPWLLTTDSHAAVLAGSQTTFQLATPGVYVSPRVSTAPNQDDSRGTPLQRC